MRENLNVLGKIWKSLGENTEKHKTFYFSIEKEVTEINKDGNESVVTIYYKLKFIDSARFTVTSLSNLVDNLTEAINKIKCKVYVFLNMKVSRII